MARRFPDDPHGGEHYKEWRIGIGEHELFGADLGHFDAELLAQLTACGVGVGFAGFAFAAGEFPEPAVALVVGALADEELVAA